MYEQDPIDEHYESERAEQQQQESDDRREEMERHEE